jgi:hypothetical protein
MSRLSRAADVDVEALEVVYCIIGVLPYPVQNLVADANTTLSELKKLSPQKLSKELGIPNIANAHAKLSMFRVVGYTFHYREGSKEPGIAMLRL